MKRSGKCPKCESTNVLADAKVRDRGDYNVPYEMTISTFRNPDAVIFKETSPAPCAPFHEHLKRAPQAAARDSQV